MRKLFIVPVLALALSFNVLAMEVPTDTVVRNLNGNQEVIKTYTVSPDTDPQVLIEDPFDLKDYHYTFVDIVKEENLVEDTVTHSEIVTVETEKNDLSCILEELPPTMEYDDGIYSGTLALDHTTIKTEAAGYARGSRRITETKAIGPLDRNDMSSVPATTVKDGYTLSLANVEWQVIGTDLVGEALVPSSYQALATYTADQYFSYATGYISTAEYVGYISRSDIESITYRVTYLGDLISTIDDMPEQLEQEEDQVQEMEQELEEVGAANEMFSRWPYFVIGGCVLLGGLLALLLLRNRSAKEAVDGVPVDEADPCDNCHRGRYDDEN